MSDRMPMIECRKICQIECQKICVQEGKTSDRMSNRMPDRMPDRMSDGMSKKVADKVSDIVDCLLPPCHIERQIESPIDCQNIFRETSHSGDHTEQGIFKGNCHGCMCISAIFCPSFVQIPFHNFESLGMPYVLKELLRSCKSPCAGPAESSLWQKSRAIDVFELRSGSRSRSTAAQSFRTPRATKITKASNNQLCK